jgi:hypothetical protein
LKKIILLIFIASVFACKKNTDQIEPANVEFYIYLTEPSFQTLNTVGNFVYVTGGVKGIIVYHKSIDEFVAFERSCPYDPNVSTAIISVDSSGLGLVDYNCGSKYNILDGSIVNGPTAYPLRQYYCEYDGVSALHIHN